MKHQPFLSLILAAALLAGFSGVAIATDAPAKSSCIECHSQLDENLTKGFEIDIHTRKGVSCEGCHGGNPKLDDEKAMDKAAGFVGKPKKADIPQFCAKCHSNPAYMRKFNPSLPTDQMEKYLTSRHGELLKKGDQKVATCVNCHQVHKILPANDISSSVYPTNVPATCATCHADAKYMAEYGIPTSQFQQYTDSANVHGYALFVKGDIGAPVCNDCHGNHGATPPGVKDVGQVCTQCHAMNGQLFLASPHKDAFDAMSIPECLFCHQQSPDINAPKARIHTIVHPNKDLIGTQKGATCIQCHERGDNGWAFATTAHADIDTIERRTERVEVVIEKAEQQGMEVSDARWKLKSEIHQTSLALRTSIHSFNLASFKESYNKSDTSLNGVAEIGISAVRELQGRRAYYYLMTIFIALTVIALIWKIKNL